MLLRCFIFSVVSFFVIASFAFGQSDTSPKHISGNNALEKDEEKSWDIEAPPGPSSEQQIDVTEGTWINLDVSPDGKQIAFDLLGDIYLMPIEGAHGNQAPTKLTSGIAWDMQPRFSPDGTMIAFTSDRTGENKKAGDNIWTIHVDGSKLTQVTQETYRLLNGPAWSPDGDYIVARKHFTSRRSLGAGEMWMYHRLAANAKSQTGIQLTKKPTDQKDVNEPIFSPDGKYLYYSEDVSPGSTFQYDKDSNKQIYVVKRLDLESGETDTYIAGPGGACRPTPSPDGRYIAFVRRIGAKTGLHLFDTKSGRVRLVYDQLERDMQEAWAIHGVYSSFAWTPDGQSIVAWAKGKIRRIDIKTGRAQIIPFHIKDTRKVNEALRFPIEVAPQEFDVKMLRNVVTSPDGKQVAYQALGHIYLRALPDGQPTRLTQAIDHFEFMPSFTQDGKHIVYVTWNDERLGEVRIAPASPGSEGRTITSEPGHYRNPVVSPDGKTVVFEKAGASSLVSPFYSHDRGIYQMAIAGGATKDTPNEDAEREVALVTKEGRRPTFGVATDRIFFLKGNGDKDADNLGLYSINLDGTKQRQHYTSTWATDYVISPNEKWIAFVERFNVYLAPFLKTGGTVKVGPGASNLPVAKVSEHAGEWIQFSGDSGTLNWSLGPELYSVDLQQTFELLTDGDKESKPTDAVSSINIGFRHPHAKPDTTVAITGGRLVTMKGDEVIDDGTIIVRGNRIDAIGPSGDIEVPEEAIVIDVSGQTVLPGLVDTHAHGSQAASGITPQRNWVDYARLAFGVTTIHDPSNNTQAIFAASEMTKAGVITAPRTFSTGTILYGATGSFKAEIDSLEDAKFHLHRMKAIGAFSVKSYNQPRRDQRQQVVSAAREMEMMVVPEGGSTFMHNMTMIVDGHTGIEHTLPVQTAYDDVMDLWRGTNVGYTPTLCVAYGGLSGENYWYEVDDLFLHPRLREFIPPHVLTPRSRRRSKAPLEDYNHIKVAQIAANVVAQGGMAQAGGHGQLNGVCTHWELWSFVQGGMSPMDALRCGTLFGAKYLGLDGDIGSLEEGKLADIVVIESGADPTKNIRDSEKIEFTIANGRVFRSDRMNELGSKSPRPPFYWSSPGYGGTGVSFPRASSCSCQR